MRQSNAKHIRFVPVLIALVCTLQLLFGFVMPKLAFARDYSIDSVNIDAILTADGSLNVEEARQFSFDGDYNGVYINIPKGTYEGEDIKPTINSVQVKTEDGKTTTLKEDSLEENNSYMLIDEDGYTQVKVYSKQSDSSVTFIFNYSLNNVGTRFEDMGQLYWKFVSDGWDVESQNVSLRLHLPVPNGESAKAGDNVLIWGHGPLDASISLDANDVVAALPGVGSSEFAEVRVLFPASWLSAAKVHTGTIKDRAMTEEQVYADEANAKREAARAEQLKLNIILVAVLLVGVVGTIYTRRDYVKKHKAQFDDKYFRDIPSSDHPAVLGQLSRGKSGMNDYLCASIMALTNDRWLKLSSRKHEGHGLFDHDRDEFILTILSESERNYDFAPASKMIYEAAFDIIQTAAEGRDSVSFDELESYAKKNTEKFAKKYLAWYDEVDLAGIEREFDADENPPKLWIPTVALVLYAGAIFLAFFETDFLGIGNLLFYLALFVAAAVYATYVMSESKKYSVEALELRAKLKALEAWLKDFTRIEESVPNDIVLWNRLLVMACALGVADRVIEQLRVIMPNFGEDLELYPSYMWFYVVGNSHTSAFDSLTEHVSSAHSISAAELTGTSASSGSGFGGGFSGGGGGGFGGGGGGGAF